jgi:hypothetical protein
MLCQANILPVFPEKYKKVLIDGVAPLCLLDVSLVYWQGFRH